MKRTRKISITIMALITMTACISGLNVHAEDYSDYYIETNRSYNETKTVSFPSSNRLYFNQHKDTMVCTVSAGTVRVRFIASDYTKWDIIPTNTTGTPTGDPVFTCYTPHGGTSNTLQTTTYLSAGNYILHATDMEFVPDAHGNDAGIYGIGYFDYN